MHGRIGDRHERPGDGDPAVLQGLAQDFQHMFLELRQFIEKQHYLIISRNLSYL